MWIQIQHRMQLQVCLPISHKETRNYGFVIVRMAILARLFVGGKGGSGQTLHLE